MQKGEKTKTAKKMMKVSREFMVVVSQSDKTRMRKNCHTSPYVKLQNAVSVFAKLLLKLANEWGNTFVLTKMN